MSEDRAIAARKLTKAAADELRRPFPPEDVDVLPRPLTRNAEKAWCDRCKAKHGQPAIHLDYVGHAAVTDRLLRVDPYWSWEPMATDEQGLPVIGRNDAGQAIMWIRLTICGVTRIGVGTAPAGKSDVEKELIGDAIRNAAMRFGVALDLWRRHDRKPTNTDDATPPPAEASAGEAADPVVALKVAAADRWGVDQARTAWQTLFPDGDPKPSEISGGRADDVLLALEQIVADLEEAS